MLGPAAAASVSDSVVKMQLEQALPAVIRGLLLIRRLLREQPLRLPSRHWEARHVAAHMEEVEGLRAVGAMGPLQHEWAVAAHKLAEHWRALGLYRLTALAVSPVPADGLPAACAT